MILQCCGGHCCNCRVSPLSLENSMLFAWSQHMAADVKFSVNLCLILAKPVWIQATECQWTFCWSLCFRSIDSWLFKRNHNAQVPLWNYAIFRAQVIKFFFQCLKIWTRTCAQSTDSHLHFFSNLFSCSSSSLSYISSRVWRSWTQIGCPATPWTNYLNEAGSFHLSSTCRTLSWSLHYVLRWIWLVTARGFVYTGRVSFHQCRDLYVARIDIWSITASWCNPAWQRKQLRWWKLTRPVCFDPETWPCLFMKANTLLRNLHILAVCFLVPRSEDQMRDLYQVCKGASPCQVLDAQQARSMRYNCYERRPKETRGVCQNTPPLFVSSFRPLQPESFFIKRTYWKTWWFFGRYLLTNEQIDLYMVHYCGLTLDLTAGYLLFFDITRPVITFFLLQFHLMNSQIFSIGESKRHPVLQSILQPVRGKKKRSLFLSKACEEALMCALSESDFVSFLNGKKASICVHVIFCRNVSVHVYRCYAPVLFRHLAKIRDAENATNFTTNSSVHQPSTTQLTLPVWKGSRQTWRKGTNGKRQSSCVNSPSRREVKNLLCRKSFERKKMETWTKKKKKIHVDEFGGRSLVRLILRLFLNCRRRQRRQEAPPQLIRNPGSTITSPRPCLCSTLWNSPFCRIHTVSQR